MHNVKRVMSVVRVIGVASAVIGAELRCWVSRMISGPPTWLLWPVASLVVSVLLAYALASWTISVYTVDNRVERPYVLALGGSDRRYGWPCDAVSDRGALMRNRQQIRLANTLRAETTKGRQTYFYI